MSSTSLPLCLMTTIRLSADDLAALREGKIIERTGGPTIKIMWEGVGRVPGFPIDQPEERICSCFPPFAPNGCCSVHDFRPPPAT